jgi:uncharacterized membrane-anchored protein
MKHLPKLDLNYWILMVLCTTMGELIGNLISRNFELGYTQGAILEICVFFAAIFLFLLCNLRGDIFYWVLILLGNIGGTNLADWVTLEPLANDTKWGIFKPLQLGTEWGSLAVLGALAFILLLRFLIVQKKGKNSLFVTVFYWLAILLSSTFGTTSGDFITNDTPFGALGGSLLLLTLIAILYCAYKFKRLNGFTVYWLALILIHPVGATIGNYISKPIGLNLGNIYTNIVLIVAFAIVYLRGGTIRE